jgi:hypothetical protein
MDRKEKRGDTKRRRSDKLTQRFTAQGGALFFPSSDFVL